MNMRLDRGQLGMLLIQRYPNTHLQLYDKTYILPKRELWLALYKGFQEWMWAQPFTGWQPERMDCDKWARLFQSYCIMRHALTDGTQGTALPCGVISYKQDIGGGHAINSVAWWDGERVILGELEPQPNNGLLEISLTERGAVWSTHV